MRTSISIGIILLVINITSFAQPGSLWTRFYGGEEVDICRGLQVLDDGSLIMAGRCNSWSAGASDFGLLKTTGDGDSLWSRIYGGTEGDFPAGVAIAENGFLMYGSTSSYGAGASDIWLIKTDANGDSVWTRTFGGANADLTRSVGQVPGGGYYIAGYTESFGAGTEDFWLLRISENGDSLWSRTFGGEPNDRCFTSLIGSDGNFYMAGDSRSYGAGDKDVWLVAASASGDSLWSSVFGEGFDEECRAILQAADGGLFLVGGKNMDGADTWNVWVIRTDINGNELWSRTYGGEGDYFGSAAVLLPDGGLVVGGHGMPPGETNQDYWLLRLAANGDSLWSASFGGEFLEVLWSVARDQAGGYYLGGRGTRTEEALADWWIVRTGSDPVTHPPGPFTRVLPEDSTFVDGLMVPFAWTRAIDLDGDEVTYLIHVESPTYPFPDPADYTTTDTTIEIEIPLPLEALDETHSLYWTVHAAAAGDTVEAANGEGIFYLFITSAEDAPAPIPDDYAISVYPNPFNAAATLQLSVPRAGHVLLELFDIQGRSSAVLADANFSAGMNTLEVNGSELASGVYFVRLTAASATCSRKLVLLK